MLSLILFDLYINYLALYLKSLGVGIQIDGEIVCIPIYADDVVLLAENENDLQTLLHTLNNGCLSNDMSLNTETNNIIHFRPNSHDRSDFSFKCGPFKLNIVDRYTLPWYFPS